MSRQAAARPDPDLEHRLASTHLRTGALLLARAELEALATPGLISGPGFADLAEARWRTGDLERAAEAATAHVAADGTSPIARLILVEAAAAAGRSNDAIDHQRSLAALPPEELAALFAGMPHRANWPVLIAGDLGSEGLGSTNAAPEAQAAPVEAPALERRATVRAPRRRSTAPFPAGEDLLVQARDDMRSGEPDRMAMAFDRMALALRMDPTMAARVVDLITRRQEPAALLVRGDAFRLMGRMLEAEAAYAAAAAALERLAHPAS